MKDRSLIAILAVVILTAIPSSISAQTLFWDPDGTTVGTSVSGNWDTVAANWAATADSGANSVWTQAADASFGIAADYTVTLTEPITVGNLTTIGSAGTLTIGRTSGNQLTLNGSVSTFSIGRSTTISAPITGTAVFGKTGGGTLTLSGTNTWSGGTTLTSGTTAIGIDSVVSGGVITSGPFGTGEISTLTTAPTLQASGGPRVIHNPVTLNVQLNVSGSQLLTFTNGDFKINGGNRNLSSTSTADTVLGGNLTDDGTARTFTKQGAGRVVLSGTNQSYLGQITVSVGTLAVGGTNAIPAANNNLISISTGATFDLNGFDTKVSRISGAGSVNLGSKTLTAGNNSSSAELTGVMSGTGGYVKVGAISQVLSGTNTFSGGITITAGSLYLPTNAVTGSPIALGAGTNTITITGTGRIGANRASPSIAIVTNKVIVNTPMAGLDAASGGDFILTGQVSGPGGFVRTTQGSGFTVLAVSNTFSGGVELDARPFGLGNKSALGTGPFVIGNPTNPPGNTIELGCYNLDLVGANAVTNAVTINQDFAFGTRTAYAAFGLELSGPVALSSRTNGIYVTGTGLFKISGVISGAGGINKAGDNTLTLAANNTYSGSTIVSTATLALTGAGSIAGSSNIDVLAGAMLDATGRTDSTLTVGAAQTLRGSGTIAGTVVVNGTLSPGDSTGMLTVNGNVNLNNKAEFEIDKSQSPANDSLATISGTITGGGTLTVTNAGAGLLAQFDSFSLFNQGVSGFTTINLPPGYSWDNQIASTGIISVLGTTFPTTATNVTASLSGTNVHLTWPSNYAGGWVIESSPDFVNWTTVAGSRDVSSLDLPINPADPPTFFRMRLLTL